MDWDEFDFAFRKLAEHLGVHPMDVWAISKPGFKPPEDDIVPMTEGLTGEISLELSLVLCFSDIAQFSIVHVQVDIPC